MKRRLVAVLMLSLLVIGGCGEKADPNDPYATMSKGELLDSCRQLSEEVKVTTTQLDSLKEAVAGAGISIENSPSIEDIGDGTGRMTFKAVDGVITFDSEFVYPESAEAANTSSINISKNISCKPYQNWTVQQKGVVTELNHASGVVGKITVGSLQGASGMYEVTEEQEWNGESGQQITVDSLQSKVAEPWFNSLANVGDVQYSRLYLESQWVGVQGSTTTLVNGTESHIVAGMFKGTADESCQYVFMYVGTFDSLKEEYMANLIRSIQVQEISLLVD